MFDAWLNPEMIGRWMFGPALRDEEIVRIALDARVGGAFSFVGCAGKARRSTTSAGIAKSTGRAASCSPGRSRPRRKTRAAWSSRSSRRAPAASSTLTHEMAPQWADFAPRVEAGWTKMLDALAPRLRVGLRPLS